MKEFVLAIVVLVSALSAGPAMGVPPLPIPNNPQSAYLGVYIPRITFQDDFQGLQTGEGAGIRLGFGDKHRILASELGAFKTRHDVGNREAAYFTGYTWNLRLSLPISDIVSPYGFAGLGQYSLETPKTVYRDKDGVSGYQAGGGFEVHLSDYFSLNLGYTKISTSFDKGTPGGVKLRTKAISYDLGLAVKF